MHRPHFLRFALFLAPILGPAATLDALEQIEDEAPRHSSEAVAAVEAKQAAEAPKTADAARDRGYLGLSVQDTPHGVEVIAVREGSGASAAGVQTGDVLRTVDGRAVADFQALREVLDEHAAGDELQVGLRRGDQELELSVELGGPGELRRARTRFSEHPPADERLGELMRRREDFDHKWQAELDERLQELREHFDRGWGELSEELGEALQERPEAAMRLREARAELNRWRDERHALLEGLRSSLRGFHWQDRQRGDDDERAPAGPRAWFGPGADGGSWSFQVPRPDADGEPQVWFFGPDGQRGKLPWKEFFAPDGSLRLEGRWEEHEEHGESEEHEDHEDHGPGGFFRWFAPDDGDEPMPRRGRMRLHSPSQPGQPGLPEPPHSPHADDQHGPDARGMADSLGELRRELRDLREELRELRRRLNER